MKQLLNDPSFIRWVKGDLKRQEAEGWNQWLRENEQNRKLAARAQQKIFGFTFDDPELPDVQSEWHNVRKEITKKKQIRPVSRRVVHAGSRRDVLSILFKAAAVLVMGAFVGLTAYMYQKSGPVEQDIAIHTVQTDYGEKKIINLSDGSTIILAAKSKISYRENWLEQPTKRLRLEGEALFDIAPQETREHPKLVVETEDGSASVWGTCFTVDTYGKGTRVVLEEGEVRVQAEQANRDENNERTVSPGEMARFSRLNTGIKVEKVNPRVYTSWSTNKLFFDNTPLSVLISRIERTYGVDVRVRDPELLTKSLSGSVDFRSLDGLTAAVAEIFAIQIQRSGGTLIIKQ